MSSLLLFESSLVWAFTTFALPQSTFVGENFDWYVGSGRILVNSRKISKKSIQMFVTDQPVEWVSRYGSLTLNHIALDHPMSGINEAGLIVVASKNHGEGKARIEDEPTINEYQWVQYQLDNYSKVSEVLAHVNDIGISSFLDELHYFICDATKQCAVIEVDIATHRLKAYSGGSLSVPVLTDLGYMETLKKFNQSKGNPKFQLDPFNSDDRFTYLAREFSAGSPSTKGALSFERVFHLLDAVKQPGVTQWEVGFDAASKSVELKVDNSSPVGKVSLAQFDFSNQEGVQTQEIHAFIREGIKCFRSFTPEDNIELVNGCMSYDGVVFPIGGEIKLKRYPEVVLGDVAYRPTKKVRK